MRQTSVVKIMGTWIEMWRDWKPNFEILHPKSALSSIKMLSKSHTCIPLLQNNSCNKNKLIQMNLISLASQNAMFFTKLCVKSLKKDWKTTFSSRWCENIEIHGWSRRINNNLWSIIHNEWDNINIMSEFGTPWASLTSKAKISEYLSSNMNI